MSDPTSNAPANAPPANALWGGRFAAGPAAVMQRINVSIGFDRKLYAQDIAGSIAHARMLARQKIITGPEAEAIVAGLEQIRAEIAAGNFVFKDAHEDIHMNVEARLADLIGPVAGRLHTARSRNDQIATDLRLWLRDALDQLDGDMKALQAALIARAEDHAATPMPGFTHLQTAQPITFGHHLMAYVEMVGRDRGRLADTRRRLNECPLGAAALAGTSYPIDRTMTATLLGFDRPTANSLDSVSDRDFAMEFLAGAAIAGIHLSRLAEEIVIWMNDRFGFVRLSDAWTTGSSIMPQKKNPDAAELVRAKSGRTIGNLASLLVVMKGLPMAYAKDMQDDKEPVFEAVETLSLCLAAMTGMVQDLTVDTAAMRAPLDGGFVTATDLADYLVTDLGMPFREAHHRTGQLVKLAETRGCGLAELPLDAFQSVEPRLTEAVYGVLSVEGALARRTSAGGTAPARVLEAVAAARERFL